MKFVPTADRERQGTFILSIVAPAIFIAPVIVKVPDADPHSRSKRVRLSAGVARPTEPIRLETAPAGRDGRRLR